MTGIFRAGFVEGQREESDTTLIIPPFGTVLRSGEMVGNLAAVTLVVKATRPSKTLRTFMMVGASAANSAGKMKRIGGIAGKQDFATCHR